MYESTNIATLDDNTSVLSFVGMYKYYHAGWQYLDFLLYKSTSIAMLNGNAWTFKIHFSCTKYKYQKYKYYHAG